MARRRRSPLKKALRAMAPHRVLWRAMSGPEIKSALRTSTKKVTVQTRQADVQRSAKKTTAAKKAAAKRADPYVVALAIPGQNRTAAAKAAKAAQPTAKKTVAVRKRNGQFDGRMTMNPAELARFEQAEQRFVDPSLLPRNARTRRR